MVKFKISLLLLFILFLLAGFSFSIYAQESNSDQSGVESVRELLKALFPSSSGGDSGNGTANGNSNNYSSATEAKAVENLRELFGEIGQKVQVPPRIIEGVMLIESPGLLNSLTDEQVQSYSQPGAIIPGCRPNQCSAVGPMQMTIGVDNAGSSRCGGCGLNQCPNAWAGYGSSVNTLGGYQHQSNPCNLRDNVYGAAAKLKKDSGGGVGTWTKDQVYRAAERYYGSCGEKYRYARLNNKTYCEFLWWYYSGN